MTANKIAPPEPFDFKHPELWEKWIPGFGSDKAAVATSGKEALVTMWACERLSDYLIGKTFHIETDHKPLVSLLGSKNLNKNAT